MYFCLIKKLKVRVKCNRGIKNLAVFEAQMDKPLRYQYMMMCYAIERDKALQT